MSFHREAGTAEVDNFYTPKNDFFYSMSPYFHLDSKRREIRLLRVFPQTTYIEHVKANPQWAPDILAGEPSPPSRQLDHPTISRLLSTHPEFDISDPKKTLIACKIVNKVAMTSIDGRYSTLSYFAGDPKDTTMILVDGLPFNAFANLEHALRCALESWTSRNPGKELLIWIDQICINQHDQVERASQVGLMRDVYRRCNETFVCLSTPGQENCLSWVPRDPLEASRGRSSAQSLELLRERPAVLMLKKYLREILLGKEAASTLEFDSPPRPASCTPPAPSLSLVLRSPRPVSAQQFGSEEPEETVEGLYHPDLAKVDPDALLNSLQAFMTSPWWCRSWVYQEFITSPRPRFLSGTTSVPWTELWPMVDFIFSGLDAFLESMRAYALDMGRSEEVRLRTEQQQRANSDHQIRMRLYEQQLQEYNLELKARREEKEWQLQATMRMQQAQVRQKEEFMRQKEEDIKRYKLDLADKATTLATKQTATKFWNVPLRLKLNYEKMKVEQRHGRFEDHVNERLREARTKARKNIYGSAKDDAMMQRIISYDRAVAPHLYSRPGINPYACKPVSYYNSSFPTPMHPTIPIEVQPSFSSDNEWYKKQTRIVTIQDRIRKFDTSTVSSTLKGKAKIRRCTDLKTLLQHSRNCKASDPRDRVYAFLGLAHKAYAIVPDYGEQNTVVQVLIDTARKIIEHDKSLALLEYVGHGRDELGYYLPSWVPDWTSKQTDSSFSKYDLVWGDGQESRPFNASLDRPASVGFRSDDNNESNLDLKVKGVQVGILDELEEAAEDDFADLQLFLMPNGSCSTRVITPRSALLDDEVWILYGASKPVVLRPEDDDTYGYLGDVLVCDLDGTFSDVMFGQMIHRVEQGAAVTRDIWLL